MSRENIGDFVASLEKFAHSEPTKAAMVRRGMELLLYDYSTGELETGYEVLPEPKTPEELATQVVELLKESMDTLKDLWGDLNEPVLPGDNVAELDEGKDLQSMLVAYLTLDGSDERLLADQYDELSQQKLRFVDAIIDAWLREPFVEAYKQARADRVQALLAGKAIRLTPLTKAGATYLLDRGVSPVELFIEGHLAEVNIYDDDASIDIRVGSEAVSARLLIRDEATHELVQEHKLEVVEPSEIGR